MILPDRVLGSSCTSMIWRGLAIGPRVFATWSRSSAVSASDARGVAAQDDEGHDGLAGGRVGGADDGRLGHLRVRDQRRLDLGRGDVVAGDEHDVVDPAEQPQVAVLVALRAVAREVEARESRPVRVDVPLVVAPDRPQHARPWVPHDEEATAARRDRRAGVVDHVGGDAWQRSHRGARLAHGHAGQRRDHDGTGLGLPPRVHDGAAVAADVLAVPHPRLRVDRLTHRAEQPQRREVELGRDVVAPLRERPDRGRRRVEDRHAVLLDELPEPALMRCVGRSLVHDGVAPLVSGP